MNLFGNGKSEKSKNSLDIVIATPGKQKSSLTPKSAAISSNMLADKDKNKEIW